MVQSLYQPISAQKLTLIILLSLRNILLTMVSRTTASGFKSIIVQSTGKKNPKESMDLCTGYQDKTEVMLKTIFNTIQSSNRLEAI